MRPLLYRYQCSQEHIVVSERRDLCGTPCQDAGLRIDADLVVGRLCTGVIGLPFVYVDDLDRAGLDLDHTYEVQAWWDGTIGAGGNLTGVAEGSEGDPALWEPWARERFTIPLFVRRPLDGVA